MEAEARGETDFTPRVIALVPDDADPLLFLSKNRLMLMQLLREGEWTVNGLAKRMRRKKEAISRDIHILQQVGLVRLKKEGRTVRPSLAAQAVILDLRPRLAVQ